MRTAQTRPLLRARALTSGHTCAAFTASDHFHFSPQTREVSPESHLPAPPRQAPPPPAPVLAWMLHSLKATVFKRLEDAVATWKFSVVAFVLPACTQTKLLRSSGLVGSDPNRSDEPAFCCHFFLQIHKHSLDSVWGCRRTSALMIQEDPHWESHKFWAWLGRFRTPFISPSLPEWIKSWWRGVKL